MSVVDDAFSYGEGFAHALNLASGKANGWSIWRLVPRGKDFPDGLVDFGGDRRLDPFAATPARNNVVDDFSTNVELGGKGYYGKTSRLKGDFDFVRVHNGFK
jgi:hypothetical protein